MKKNRMNTAMLHIKKIGERLSIRARILKWQAMASTLSIDGHHDDAMHRSDGQPKFPIQLL
jgi:predicted transcriptional regulator